MSIIALCWALIQSARMGIVGIRFRLDCRLGRPEGRAMRSTETTAGGLLTLGDAATRLGCQSWQIRKMYTKGILPEPPRIGGVRVLAEADLPALRAALLKAGYLKD